MRLFTVSKKICGAAIISLPFALNAAAEVCRTETEPAIFQSRYRADNEAVKQKLEKLLPAVRADKSNPAVVLPLPPLQILPYLAVHLNSKDEMVRQKAVNLIGSTKLKQALPLLAAALADESARVRSFAAQTLYDNFAPDALDGNPDIENALCLNVENKTDSAAVIVLFSRFVDNEQTEKVLRLRAESVADETVVFYPLTESVKFSFVLKMALSEVGGREPRRDFRRAISTATLEELTFLVWTMQELGDADLLHDLRKTLFDNRQVSYENAKGVIMTRRLRDLAIEKFVKKLKLKPAFKIADGKIYSTAESQQIDKMISRIVPQS